MNFQGFSLPLFLLFLFKIYPSFSINNNPYTNCTSIFSCGIITNLGFPFWGQTRPEFCGHPKLKLTCDNEITKIEIAKVKYKVLEVNLTARILRIARDDYSNGICPKTALVNTTLDPDMFEILPGYGNLTLFYGCDSLMGKLKFECAVYGKGGVWSCRERVEIPVRGNGDYLVIDPLKMEEAIRDGFEVKWKVDDEDCEECVKSSGVCGYDFKMNRSICFCQNQDSSSSSSGIQACWDDSDDKAGSVATSGRNGPKRSRLIIGLVIGGAGILGLFLGYLIFHISCRRKKHMMKLKSKDLSSSPSSADIPTPSTFLSRSIPSFPYSRSDLEKGSSYFGAQVFTYTELEKATSNFDRSRELGDGGYGTVYAGKLHDGRIVAVKRLYENNYKRVEQFMNEVEILSQLQHPNLVKLYGCTSRHSQELLLVYEYIPNGTVADHLHGKQANSGLLSWSVRLRIAIETATALAYLHRKDIIHRDVKTNNILLDNNFQVKVADFGLSRLFPNDVTHVSTAPQGTPGYVDPEYYQCYQLTNKSDVYSFGVVLVELISSLQAVDINRNRNDINLCNMAVNRIQNHALHELVDPNIGFERDYAVRCMITSVAELAFRCLQQAPILRPSMDEVLDVLRGIENEELGARKAEVLDIGSDDVRLLR